ncbi:hypothetical protein OF83DRAFT_1052258 [Amylostereum chailletii]|nr:hypothetical protein OF83DRAFT_1052258 [Amylostereum chailletii]
MHRSFIFGVLSLPLLVHASTVYLHPPLDNNHPASSRSASALIAQHLRLERFEPLDDGQLPIFSEPFVGQGETESLLLSVEQPYIKDVIPDTLKPSFSLRFTSFDPSDLLSTLLARAQHVYNHVSASLSPSSESSTTTLPATLDLFSVPHPATEAFLSSLTPLISYLEESTTSSDKFGAFTLTGLDAIAKAYGRTSEQYSLATTTLRAALQSALAHPNIRIVLLTSPTADVLNKRQDPVPSSVPPQLVSDALCFATEEACTNSTNSCSGNGKCAAGIKAGKECFACSCVATKNEKGLTENWAGERCERRDISSSFVLLAGTTIALFVVVAASVGLLVGAGGELPSVLTGGVAPSKRE